MVSISDVTITQDKDGDPDVTTEVLINQLRIPNEVVDHLESLVVESADVEEKQAEDDSVSDDTDEEDPAIE